MRWLFSSGQPRLASEFEQRRANRRTAMLAVSWGVLSLLSLFTATKADAQGSRKDDVVFNAQGRPMAGATVRVCTASATGQPCTPLANIYSDPGLTQAMANPLATDGLGNYTFYAAPGLYEIEISGPNITTKQMPNVILPNDPSTPTFTSLATTSGITAFSLSLSGNLTVNGSTAVTGTLTQGGAPVATTAPTFVTYNAESSLPNSRQLVNGTGTTVDTSVAGQIKIDASGASAFPYSVSAYGARSIDVNSGVETTATCTSSSTSVTLASAVQFQTGDGIFLPGCGAATSLMTPSTPTVTPVALAGPENSGLYVALTGQSTSYAYCISAEDLGNGHTACSSTASTASGDATLGLHTATVSSFSLSGTTVTATLTTSPTDLPAGAYVHIHGADPAQFDFWGNLQAVSGNTVTYSQAENSNYGGVSTSGSSGTLTWHVANLITLPSGTGAQDFIVYGRTSGSLGYQCISAHDTANGYQQLWYMDHGATETANCAEPAWIPSTPPASALADGLVTTIAAGGGTTSLTLAAAATTSSGTNGATAQYDNCAQVQAAASAAENGSGVLYFPPGEWVVGSYCQLPPGMTINQAGVLELYNTVEITGSTKWYADRYASWSDAAQFGIAGYGAPTYVESPYPAIFANGNRSGGGGNGLVLQGLYVQDGTVKDQSTLALLEEELAFQIDSSVFATGQGSYDYLGTTLNIRAVSNSFDNSITNSTFTDTMQQSAFDESWAPTILIQGAVGDFKRFDNINTSTRGGIGWFEASGGSIVLPLFNLHAQGPDVPIVATNWQYGYLNFTNLTLDSSSASAVFVAFPGVANYSLGTFFSGPVTLTNAYQPGSDTYGYPGAIGGEPVFALVNIGVQDNLGQNSAFDLFGGHFGQTVSSFSAASPALEAVNQPTGPTVVPYKTYAPLAFTPSYATPSASVTSGGSVPVGTYCYQYAPIYPSGGLGVLSGCASATTTSGNQTVTSTLSALPAGAANVAWFRNNGNGPVAVNLCWDAGLSCTDTYAYTYGSAGPTAPADGYPHYGSDGVRTPQVTTGALTGALATKSSAYTLTSSDYWVNVTGTTSITVPHAIVGQHWVVFNSGSNTVTVAADSGNINGAASITLSANTGKEIACDGSNCFAH